MMTALKHAVFVPNRAPVAVSWCRILSLGQCKISVLVSWHTVEWKLITARLTGLPFGSDVYQFWFRHWSQKHRAFEMPSKPYFHKIILPKTLQDRKLVTPFLSLHSL
ncbi:hypothetical protein LINPERPRIM_LOCUS16604 [Linum perenne]